MTPWVSMPRGPDAPRAAALAELRHALRALACAARLLSRRVRSARDRAILSAMRRAIRGAEAALKRLPNR